MSEARFRDSKWGCFEDEMAPTRMAADLAYLGAQVGQAERIIGRKLSGTALRRLFKLLSPNRRRAAGDRRSGGRSKGARALKRLPNAHREMLIGILADYHTALTLGIESADARLAAWQVFDAARAAGAIDVDEESISLDLWLFVVELVQQRRVVITKCGCCGTPNMVVDMEEKMCVKGGHYVKNAGPYFLAADGTDSPLVTPQRA